MRDSVQLTFFVIENQHHGGQPLYQWLLREAAAFGMPGGTAFRAMAGFGRHHILHEAHFYELAGELPMEVVFVTDEADAGRLIAHIGDAGLSVFHVMTPVRTGTTGAP
jgi:uncharacterized protein